jgi:hypothetical protein
MGRREPGEWDWGVVADGRKGARQMGAGELADALVYLNHGYRTHRVRPESSAAMWGGGIASVEVWQPPAGSRSMQHAHYQSSRKSFGRARHRAVLVSDQSNRSTDSG